MAGSCLLSGHASLAGSATVQVANEEVRDGVHGVLTQIRADIHSDLRRHRIQLDPARQRLFIVLLDSHGRLVFHGHELSGVGPGVNSATTTPPLPADGALKSFFVPYHRLDLPPGTHKLTMQLHLDAGLDAGPIHVATEDELTVRMPTLDWIFASVEQPPMADPRIVWRARLGQDVMAQGSPQTPSVIVLGEEDYLQLEVFDSQSHRWETLNRSSLANAAADAGIELKRVRSVQVRRRPPKIRGGNLSIRPQVYREQQGRRLDLGWTLTGGSLDVLLELQVVPIAGTPDGDRVRLPAWSLGSVPGRASLFIPDWGLPDWVQADKPIRIGFEILMKSGKGSPLTRDLILGGHESTLTLDGQLTRSPLTVRQVAVDVVDDDGLTLELRYEWTLPDGLPELLPGVPLNLHHDLLDARVQPLSKPAFLHTPCPDGQCSEAWSSGSVRVRSGQTKVQLPLYLFDPNSREPVRVHVAGRPDGYRGVETSLLVDAVLPTARTMTLRPTVGSFECRPGSSIRLAWTGKGGEQLASTAARPCKPKVKWTKDDALSVTAFDNDTLLLSIELDGEVIRRTPVRVTPQKAPWSFEAPFVGVRSLQGKLVVE
ncbi:MAG: hypothetical protein ACI9MC_003127 [Kiritimatiellia bacterium]|jgi:hypothetical protein